MESRIRELEAYLSEAGFEDCTLTTDEQMALSSFNNHRKFSSFKIGDLFEIKKGKRLTKSNMIEGTIPFIGATASNNGRTALIGNSSHLHPDNVITVTYNGSVGEAFYQTEKFWASDDVNVLYFIAKLTENLAFFFLAPLKKKGKGYGYSYKWTRDKMLEDYLDLPITENGDIDLQFIEFFISAIKKQYIQSLKDFIAKEHNAYEKVISSQS